MREIKFRAWDEAERKMRFPNLIGKYGDAHTCWWTKDGSGHMDTKEIMQYTGLKDKNGKEGYHKDLWLYLGLIYTVEWDDYDAEFYLKHPSSSASDNDHIKMMGFGLGEVIGNIYEHPELAVME